jgi:hypothetical protein
MARILERQRNSHAQAFLSWQNDGAFRRGTQSEAALAACGHRLKADDEGTDRKAAVRDGMIVVGGGRGR